MSDYKLRHILFLCALSCVAALCSPALGAEPASLLLADGWSFRPAPDRDERLIANAPEDLRIAAPDNADVWAPVSITGGWNYQGFNPSRAGWYRCTVELPESWKGRILALDLTARCRSEIVFCNGEPIGASRRTPDTAAEAAKNVYLLPSRITRAGTLALAVRMDAPGVPAPGAAAAPVLRPAALYEYMTPPVDSQGRLLNTPDGADFFPQDPFEINGMLVNIGTQSFGCVYEHGQDAHVQILAVPFDTHQAAEFASVTVNYSISNNMTGTEVVSGGFVLKVPPSGTEKDLPLFSAEPGAYTARFLFTAGGVSKVTQMRYCVFPERTDMPLSGSPFGLMLTAPTEITRLSGAPWIMQPGLLKTTFTWGKPDVLTQPALRRLSQNARAGNYSCILNSDANADASTSPIQNFALPDGDAAEAARQVRRAYLQHKAGSDAIFQLMVPASRIMDLAELAAAGVFEYCDVVCVTYVLPVAYTPEDFVREKMREIRQALVGLRNDDAPVTEPPAIALNFASNAPVPPRMVVRTCLQAIAAGAWKVYWDANGYGNTAWLYSNYVPKAQLGAFAAMNSVLREAYYVGTLNFGEGVSALAFYNGQRNVLVVWKRGEQAFVKLPPAEQVLGIMGDDMLEHNSGLTEIMLSDRPVYLYGVTDADIAGIMPADTVVPSDEDVRQRFTRLGETNLAAGLTVRPEQRQLFIGKSTLALTLENWFGTEFVGTARLTLPDRWNAEPQQQAIQFPPTDNRPSQVRLAFETDVLGVEPNDYTFRLDILDGGEVVASFELVAAVTTPLGDFSNIHLTQTYTATPSMAVPVENLLDEPITARVGLRIPNWSVAPRFLPVTLAPGEKKLLHFMANGRLPVVGPLPVSVQMENDATQLAVNATADISTERLHGWAVGQPEVQTLRFDGQTISYRLSKMAVASVRIYDPDGTLLDVLDAGWQMAGPHTYTWVPERKFDADGQRIKYVAEVRAGFDLVYERQMGASPGAVFAPHSVEKTNDGIVAFDGRRALRFSLSDDLQAVDLPALQLDDVRDIAPLPDGTYAVIRGNQLLLVDKLGKILTSAPAAPRADGDIALGHFRSPAALAVSDDGEIYVADSGNNRIQRFDAQLQPLPFRSTPALGKKGPYGCPLAGTAAGEFTQPWHIFFKQKRLFVLDATGRLQIFDRSGNHLQTVQTMLKDVACITADNDAVYLCRWNSGKISRFTLRNDTLAADTRFGNGGSVATAARQVQSLEVDRRGRLLACTSYPGQIAALDAATGRRLGAIGRTPTEELPVSPAGIDADSAGGLIYTDVARQSVNRLGPTGKLLWSVPGPQLPASLHRPVDAVFDHAGNVYVLDKAPSGVRLLALDDHGAPRFLFNGSYLLDDKSIEGADCLEITESGLIWAGTAGRGVILNTAGNIVSRQTARPPTRAHAGGLQFSPCDQGACAIMIADRLGHEIARKGSIGWQPGEFGGCMPGGLAASPGGQGKADRVFYADIFNHRIVVLRVDWTNYSQASAD